MRTKVNIKGEGWLERVSDHRKCHSENLKMRAQTLFTKVNKKEVRDVNECKGKITFPVTFRTHWCCLGEQLRRSPHLSQDWKYQMHPMYILKTAVNTLYVVQEISGEIPFYIFYITSILLHSVFYSSILLQ